jgi:hypothetical protein
MKMETLTTGCSAMHKRLIEDVEMLWGKEEVRWPEFQGLQRIPKDSKENGHTSDSLKSTSDDDDDLGSARSESESKFGNTTEISFVTGWERLGKESVSIVLFVADAPYLPDQDLVAWFKNGGAIFFIGRSVPILLRPRRPCAWSEFCSCLFLLQF